ncbi:hypothetical protein ACFSCX_05885 [Bacillus salitolerans]|uniref:Uncharacterized protein n=1 Tax=Bacillus salitolerans TaxID=1437434 RepID=A0ABW4LNP3_9BACI
MIRTKGVKTTQKTITFQVSTRCCNQIIDIPNVTKEQVQLYKKGAHVQVAFPHVKASVREVLISGTCEDCWNKLFGTDCE